MKKLISVILIITLLFSFMVIPTHAESDEDTVTPTLENNISVDSTNSFGGLISQTINSEMEKQLENNGFNVFSVEYSEGETLVELEALQDCTLFVGIYSEDGTKLVTSQSIEVTRDDTLITLSFDTSIIPEYFIIQAYLINTDDLKPLCSVYNSNMYTQEMQEFLSKTTDNFESDKVLQLDDDKTNNFAVYNDTVEIIEKDLEMTVTADEENGVYTITNPTDEVKALQVGDIFSYNYDNGDILILKIASIATDKNGTITYTEGELELEDVFDYVKIDADAPTNSATVDTSELDEGIVYNGCIENPSTYSLVDIETTSKFSHSYEFFEYDVVKAESDEGTVKTTISGSLSFEISAKFKVYIALNKSTVEIKFDYKLTPSIELSTSLKGYIPLGKYSMIPVTGIIVTLEPSFVIECSGKMSFGGSVLGSIGFKLDTESGINDLSKLPKVETEFKIEATIFVGLSFKPTIKILSDKIAKASIDAVIGGEIKSTLSAKQTTDDEKHICNNCLGGEIYTKFDMKYNIKLLNKDKWDFKYTIANVKLKVSDFYFSGDFFEFNLTKCPHKEYRLTVNVNDNNGKVLKGIKVEINSKNDTTNTLGNASVFLPDGEYTVKIVNDKYIPVSKSITVNGKAQKIKINLSSLASAGDGSGSGGGGAWGDSVVPISANKLSLGGQRSAVIVNGSLYMWGHNEYGQLGNGTTTNSLTPIKVMDNVVSVSLGFYHSAAITKDGSLYTWGRNGAGQLGNGSTTNCLRPKKIMDNVVSVNLGNSSHSAAITKDGSLYTWGDNEAGQLGDGTTIDCLRPKKIMDNVVSVGLGGWHSAAITKDGSLYTWGANGAGRLGNGTTTDSYKPQKIMDNVVSVNLGAWYSSAITKDGSLYTWGFNRDGQLGDGTTTNSLKPRKLMDNVASVSLGNKHSAAITKDGSLYTWGFDQYIGHGYGLADSYLPKKIMNNVASVSLGWGHIAVITNDGTLYTWGGNTFGELGNGTTTRSLIPIKINLPKIATYSLRNTATNQNEFINLIPNFIYNYYVMESDAVVNPLNSQNLKFIGQAVSDEYGNLKLPEYTADIASTEPTIILKEFARVSGELEYLISSEGTAIITGCTAKNAASIPDSLGDYKPTAIANMAFTDCYNLTDVTLSNSITEIADGTFFAQENIVLHSNCKNDNTYFEKFATEQEIEFIIEHNYDDWVTVTEATPVETGIKHKFCTECGDEVTEEIPTVDKLAFKGASLTLHHNLAINYKVDKALFDTVGYTNSYVVFEIGGKKTTVKAYAVEGDRYVFRFRNIAPNQMNDTIYATLYATYNGVEYASETREYSVAEYCYSTLNKYASDDYAELRTLLVDLLHYGAQSQLYTKYNVDNLVNANLTEVQLAWGTDDDPTLTNSLNTEYETVENPLITWKGASLNLNDSVSMRFKFIAEDIDGLSLKIASETGEWNITSNNFVLEDGVYTVRFSGLNAGQMSEKVYITMYKDGVAVSNTVCYSIESYAYSKQDSTIEYLSDLVKAMMKYGNSAHSYVN